MSCERSRKAVISVETRGFWVRTRATHKSDAAGTDRFIWRLVHGARNGISVKMLVHGRFSLTFAVIRNGHFMSEVALYAHAAPARIIHPGIELAFSRTAK